MPPATNMEPHDSCHHRTTSLGDTFGGLGTCSEPQEETLPRQQYLSREQAGREDRDISQEGSTQGTP